MMKTINRILYATLVVTLITILQSLAFAQDYVSTQQGTWSKKSKALWPEKILLKDKPAGVYIKSPKAKYELHVKEIEVEIAEPKTRKIIGKIPLYSLSLSEILWSQEESIFAVTQSEGGLVGTWFVTVWKINDNGAFTLIDKIDRYATTDFQKRVMSKSCPDETPNMGAITWVNSTNLLIVGEVPPHSSCTAMGSYGGYIIDIQSGKITKQVTEKELQENWGVFLGTRLKN